MSSIFSADVFLTVANVRQKRPTSETDEALRKKIKLEQEGGGVGVSGGTPEVTGLEGSRPGTPVGTPKKEDGMEVDS